MLKRKLRLKVPKSIQIGGYIYTVVFNLGLDKVGWTAQHCLNGKRTTLEFNPSRTMQERNEAFFHELTHAIDNVFNHSELEEATVDHLGHGQYQVFHDLFELDWSGIPTINEPVELMEGRVPQV